MSLIEKWKAKEIILSKRPVCRHVCLAIIPFLPIKPPLEKRIFGFIRHAQVVAYAALFQTAFIPETSLSWVQLYWRLVLPFLENSVWNVSGSVSVWHIQHSTDILASGWEDAQLGWRGKNIISTIGPFCDAGWASWLQRLLSERPSENLISLIKWNGNFLKQCHYYCIVTPLELQ